MNATQTGIRCTRASDAPTSRPAASSTAELATKEHTGGRYSLIEVIDAPNSGPPMHRHTREDEAYYILDGEYHIVSEDGSVLRATPGAYVHVDRGTVHTYK